MKPAGVVDRIDKMRKVLDDIGEGLEGHRIDCLDFERLHKAFRLCVVIWVAAAAHRTDAAVSDQGIAIGLGGVLRATVGMLHASGSRFAAVDRSVEGGQRQPLPLTNSPLIRTSRAEVIGKLGFYRGATEVTFP